MLKALFIKLHIVFDLLVSRTYVVATDRSGYFYAFVEGWTAEMQLYHMKMMQENLVQVIEELESSLGETNGRN